MLEKPADLGVNVVVVDTEGMHPGSDVAELLLDGGKNVEIVTAKPYVGASIELLTWRLLYERLMRKGVVMSPSTASKEIREGSVVVYCTITGQEQEIHDVDALVFAVGGTA